MSSIIRTLATLAVAALVSAAPAPPTAAVTTAAITKTTVSTSETSPNDRLRPWTLAAGAIEHERGPDGSHILTVDLGRIRPVVGVALEPSDLATDLPLAQWSVEVSWSGKTWHEVDSGTGPTLRIDASFPDRWVQFVRIILPQDADPAWSGASVDVFRPARLGTLDPAPQPQPHITPTPEPEPEPSQQVGSLPVGQARYPVPAGAIYAVADGAQTGTGTKQHPYGSLQYAIDRASSGDTVVLRAGHYHETTRIPFNKALTIQNYPGEAVWIDGSEQLTGWSRTGATWSVPWDHAFDTRVSHTSGRDETSRFLDPRYPAANLPEGVWVNGTALEQVTSLGAVGSDTFYVDRSAGRLHIGRNPSGVTIEATTLAKALTIHGEGSVIRGIGVQRYANHLALMGAVTAEVKDIRIENVVVRDTATVGLYGWNTGKVFDRVTVSGNGMLGMGLNDSDGALITGVLATGNNAERFKAEPVAGGAKFTTSDDMLIRDSSFSENVHAGLWLDEFANDSVIVRNTIEGNTGTGVQVELLTDALLAGNSVHDNGAYGVSIVDASDVTMWNSTVVFNGKGPVRMAQDSRYSSATDWFTRGITVRNTVLGLSGSSALCPIVYDDQTRSLFRADLSLDFDHNLLHRDSATAPERITCLPNGASGLQATRTLSQLRSIGWEANGHLAHGSEVTLVRGEAVPTAVGTALPADVAEMIGAEPGSTIVGVPWRS
ncbi:right-handed parallel beta-helix repeat-containing protein [Serinibacter salmoneus]|uniref:Parallel beta helix pectate lyase-like protein n=1 Tax=Serinibacter salmoneus TaxID=556530 RepID=A0A2A9D5L8_9MICO|nr:right-handed parallel beta-helix repeat-containing protein [Serinibacter salmoneus]PFG21139.1 parallel beta helix pectate lyase-like protein [Serinibacter salmoneus]